MDETVVRLLGSSLATLILGGGLGVRWLIQRRNGNHNVTSGQFKTAMTAINTRFDETRGWLGEIDKKQTNINNRLSYCEGFMKGKSESQKDS